MSANLHTADRRIGVMHLIHTVAYGGVESVVLNWLGAIDRARFDVHLVCFANPGGTEEPFVREAERRGFAVSRIVWNRRKPVWRAARSLAGLIRANKIDVLHTHNEYANIVGAVASFMRRVKTITTVYVRGRWGWRRNTIQAIDTLVLRRFDRVTAHCEETQRVMSRALPEHDIRTLICGFKINRDAEEPAERLARRRGRGVAADDVLLVNVARLYPEKDQAFLLRCFAEIVRRRPQARLWIVGVGPLEAELKSLAAGLNLLGHVRFLGWVESWSRLLPLCDVQVHPATIEGVSLAVGEGMAAGLPLVASEVGGLREIITHERTGLFVPHGDERKFIEQTLRLIDDAALRGKLGEAARRFIDEEYSIEVAVHRLEETYREMKLVGTMRTGAAKSEAAKAGTATVAKSVSEETGKCVSASS